MCTAKDHLCFCILRCVPRKYVHRNIAAANLSIEGLEGTRRTMLRLHPSRAVRMDAEEISSENVNKRHNGVVEKDKDKREHRAGQERASQVENTCRPRSE